MAEEITYLGRAAAEQLVEEIKSADSATLVSANEYADSLADNYDAAGTAATKVQELADGQVKTNTDAIAEIQKDVNKNTSAIGTMDDLQTTEKTELVKAVNEVVGSVAAGNTAAKVTITENTSNLGEGVAKSYTIKQGVDTVGTINIPKDMVVQSGEVVVNPEGMATGTYIRLVLANATNDEIYVNVGTLVDIYTVKSNAAQVQLAIDPATREISASIVAGSITVTELADNAVTTVKIADANVTKAKLSTEVQASLDKADVAATDATTKANKALEDAKAYTDTGISGLRTDVDALKAVTHVAITADEITAMFNA